MGTQTKDTLTPPYLPYSTYTGFIDQLRATVTPSRIDNSVMGKFSGSMKPLLRGALRFTGAIDDAGTVQPKFRALVEKRGTPDWSNEFNSQFASWYRHIIGDLDLKTATLQQLKDRFKESGVDGSVMIKAVRFYLAALKETGQKYSPHLDARGLSTGVTPKTARRKNGRPSGRFEFNADDNGGAVSGQQTERAATPKGFERLSLPLRGRAEPPVLVLPHDLKENEWHAIDTYVRLYFNWKAAATK